MFGCLEQSWALLLLFHIPNVAPALLGCWFCCGAPALVPWGGWHSSAPLGSPCPSPRESWGWGCCIFLSSTGEKSPSFEPKQHQLRLEQSAGPSLPGARMGLGSGPCALGVLLAQLPSHLCERDFPLLDSSFTLGIFFTFTQHPQLLVLGVLRLMRDQCPRGRGCSETQNEIRQICGFIQGEIHLCFSIQTKTSLNFFWHLGERLGAVSRGTLSSVGQERPHNRGCEQEFLGNCSQGCYLCLGVCQAPQPHIGVL